MIFADRADILEEILTHTEGTVYKIEMPLPCRKPRRRRRYRNYNSYMKSERWRKLRLKVLARDDYQCQRCGSAKNLRIHHLTYERVGHEALDDLITLCEACHSEIHRNDLREGRSGSGR